VSFLISKEIESDIDEYSFLNIDYKKNYIKIDKEIFEVKLLSIKKNKIKIESKKEFPNIFESILINNNIKINFINNKENYACKIIEYNNKIKKNNYNHKYVLLILNLEKQ